ncbi:MAG: hypothetical protein ABEH81_01340 [Halopenitus sp.]
MSEEYARVVTNSTEIEELTDLVRMKGKGTDGKVTSLVEDAIINFEDDWVSVKAFDPMASVWTHIRGDFEDVRSQGRLAIGSIDDFRSYLDRFGDKTIVSEEERGGVFYLTFNDENRKDGAYSATDEAHIQSVEDVEELPYQYNTDEMDYPGVPEQGIYLDTWFRCDVSDITDVINDGDTTEVRKFPFAVEDGHVSVRVGSDDKWIETEFDAYDGGGQAESLYGYGVDNVFSNISGEIEVYLADNSPMWIRADNEDMDYVADYMIAEDEESA